MSRTAWSHSSKGGLTSDRLNPPPPKKQQQQSSAKGKQQEKAPPKSAEVVRLEGVLAGLAGERSARAPPPGCFCQARKHPLSPYTPLCASCGLILCALQLPYAPCPHCAASLLSPLARDSMVAQVQAELEAQLEAEERARVRAEEARRDAQGAFPTLNGAPPRGGLGVHAPVPAAPAPTSHVVISLGAKGKKATKTTYRTPPPGSITPSPAGSRAPSAPPPPATPPDERVAAPAADIAHFAKGRMAATAWADLGSGERVGALYVARAEDAKEGGKGRRRRGKGPAADGV